MIELTREQAQRIAVRAQLLDGTAREVLPTVERLGYLQLDPTSAVAPSHLIVLWSRLGTYDRGELERLLWRERALLEWRAFVYPTRDLPLLRARMRRFGAGAGSWERRAREWLATNASFRRYVLTELRRRGPLVSRELEDRSVEPWRSSGWTNTRNVSQMLEFLWARGDVAVVGRAGGQRLWDVAERWYPPTETLAAREAERRLAEQKLRTLGIAREGPGVEARVRGVEGTWFVDRELLRLADEELPGRTTLLSPFDRLIYDRERTDDLWGFRYRLEIYVAKEKREYGYFVLPILHRHELVGRIDPFFDRRQRVLRVNAVYAEPGARRDAWPQIRAAIDELAAWLGAREAALPRLPDPWR